MKIQDVEKFQNKILLKIEIPKNVKTKLRIPSHFQEEKKTRILSELRRKNATTTKNRMSSKNKNLSQ